MRLILLHLLFAVTFYWIIARILLLFYRARGLKDDILIEQGKQDLKKEKRKRLREEKKAREAEKKIKAEKSEEVTDKKEEKKEDEEKKEEQSTKKPWKKTVSVHVS